MTIDELLASADPAQDLLAGTTDGRSPVAEALLARIVSTSERPVEVWRRPRRVVTGRRLASGVVLAAAAVVALALLWGGSGSGTSRAYAVTPGDGAVRVAVHWSQLSDPAALQAALDQAGAQTTIFVSDDPGAECPAPPNTTPYSSDAVQWTSSPNADDAGFVVRPGSFPTDGTFVVSVHLARPGQTGESTFSPDEPQLETINSFMVVGTVPTCGP